MEDGAIGIAAWWDDIIVGSISIESKEIEFCIDTREEDVTGLGGEALYLVGVHSGGCLGLLVQWVLTRLKHYN